jgi:Galactose oxidase, central domain
MELSPERRQAAGSFNVVVTVSDLPSSTAHTMSTNYTIQIISSTLTISSGALPAGQVGVLYGQRHIVQSPRGPLTVTFFQLSAGGGGASLSWSWVAAPCSSLPPGLTCCRASFGGGIPFGRGVIINGAIAGVPTFPGNYQVVVTAFEDVVPPQQASATYTITIAPPPPPSVNLTPAPAVGTLNSPYVGFSFTATEGLPPLSWSESGPLPPGMVLDAAGLLSGTPTTAGTFPISVHVVDAVGQVSTSENFDIQILAQGFAPTASMGTARIFHTASLLNNGKVLVAGGANSDGEVAGSEVFDVTTKTFVTAGNMGTARHSHTATVLVDGRVVVIGGLNSGNTLTTAEIFNATNGSFSQRAVWERRVRRTLRRCYPAGRSW